MVVERRFRGRNMHRHRYWRKDGLGTEWSAEVTDFGVGFGTGLVLFAGLGCGDWMRCGRLDGRSG